MKRPIFLSASVPYREPFVSDCDPVAIREAVLALVAVAVRERQLVFGGHPAISPLVEHAARSLGALKNVHIYQSSFYKDVVPEVARKFDNLHWTKIVGAGRGDRARSETEMRIEMIRGWDYCAAVFVGGMEGLFEERDIFRKYHQKEPLIAVGSTGGAAKQLLEKESERLEPDVAKELREERRYRRLFKKLLPTD